MAGWLALMLIVAIAGRETLRELNVFQVMELRSAIGFAMLYPLVHLNGGISAMRTAKPLKHISRNIVHYGSQLCWFYALTLIPMAQVVSIEFTMPVWTAILATLFLRERMTVWEDHCDPARDRRRVRHRAAGDRRDQSGPDHRAGGGTRLWCLDRADEVADPHREHHHHYFLDADPSSRRQALCRRFMGGDGLQPMSGCGAS